MSTATTPPAYMMPGVTLFASGVYHGKPWPADRVDLIAAKVRELGPSGLSLLVPPSVLGHEEQEDQDWLNRTDLPAAGWVDPDSAQSIADPENPGEKLLIGDVVNIPVEVAERLKKREFARCSAEFYEFTDDFGRGHGLTLRRLAFLGGEVPQVKRIPPLPDPVPMAEIRKFSERATKTRNASTTTYVLAFSERSTMDRAQMAAAVLAAMPGISQAWVDAQSDDALAELVKNLPAPTTATEVTTNAEDPATMTREQLLAALVAKGEDAAALEAKTDDELRGMLVTPMSEDEEKKEEAAKMSERAKAAETAAKASLSRIQAMERKAAEREQKTKVKDAEVFCESLVKEGRLTPAQVKAMALPALVGLDDTNATAKFSENGKTETLTPYEAKKRELSKLPVVIKFGEKVHDGTGSDLAPEKAKEQAIAKARQHAEVLGDGVLKQTSFKNKAGFVAAFSESYDRDPQGAMKRYLPNG